MEQGSTTNTLTPRVIATNTYYPFGMLIGSLSGNSEGYRYGFNGMELDNEVKGVGNSIDFGARIYDPRLGRWLASDPLAQKYPFLSPYNFVSNKPIIFIDPDGRKIDWGRVTSASDRKAVEAAIAIWKESELYLRIWEELDACTETVYLIEIVNCNIFEWYPKFIGNYYTSFSFPNEESNTMDEVFMGDDRKGGYITFNMTALTSVMGTTYTFDNAFDLVFEGAGEEIIHAWQYHKDVQRYGNKQANRVGTLNMEYEGKAIKGIIKRQAGIPFDPGTDNILENFGINLFDGKTALERYFDVGREWLNHDRTHPSYKDKDKYWETGHSPETLKSIINENQ